MHVLVLILSCKLVLTCFKMSFEVFMHEGSLKKSKWRWNRGNRGAKMQKHSSRWHFRTIHTVSANFCTVTEAWCENHFSMHFDWIPCIFQVWKFINAFPNPFSNPNPISSKNSHHFKPKSLFIFFHCRTPLFFILRLSPFFLVFFT